MIFVSYVVDFGYPGNKNIRVFPQPYYEACKIAFSWRYVAYVSQSSLSKSCCVDDDMRVKNKTSHNYQVFPMQKRLD